MTPTYAVSNWLFLRLLGVTYFIAFASLAGQIVGLAGHDGILPAYATLAAIATPGREHSALGQAFARILLWAGPSDRFLEAICVGGAALASLLAAGGAPLLLLPLLWAAYLTLIVICPEFLLSQFDMLLVEAGLLAMLVAPLAKWDRLKEAVDPPPIARWLLWWLLFRLMLGSGIAKLATGDPSWRNLTAVQMHYETQPLPTTLAWYFFQMPLWFHKASTAAVLAIELVVVWLVWLPRGWRMVASALVIALQIMMMLIGDYAFFNLLTAALAITVFDDAALDQLTRGVLSRDRPTTERRLPIGVPAAAAIVVLPVSLVTLAGQLDLSVPGSALVTPLVRVFAKVHSVNAYGPFSPIATTRSEIIVEGSNDGSTWLPYGFRYKPGDPRTAPSWAAPGYPRLDWALCLAPLIGDEPPPWFQRFSTRLLEDSPTVLGLLASDPFPGTAPTYIRSVLYRYRFADVATRRSEGVWWTRERLRLYSPVISLGRLQ